MNLKQLSLLLISSSLAAFIGLLIVRWMMPGLLGVPVDLQVVQVDKKVPPFFDNIFRAEDLASTQNLISDPYIMRGKPLIPDAGSAGPHDILGFRNLGVPNIADVISIGDSQTYGNNVRLAFNWPGRLSHTLSQDFSIGMYNMAVSGWGAVEYWEIFQKALIFRPRVVIVAFYTGNDPVDSFKRAYQDERWRSLQPNPDLNVDGLPEIVYPPPDSSLWSVAFEDGVKTVFTPTLRLQINQQHPAIDAGYEIMSRVAADMRDLAMSKGVGLIFTIIPTIETVYATKIKAENISPPPDYLKLVEVEQARIETLATRLQQLEGADYIDVTSALQAAAMRSEPLYPEVANGHPIRAGYQLIAETLAPAIHRRLMPNEGLAALEISENVYRIFLIKAGGLWEFSSQALAESNGWTFPTMPLVAPRALNHLRFRGKIESVEPEKFGPAAVNASS